MGQIRRQSVFAVLLLALTLFPATKTYGAGPYRESAREASDPFWFIPFMDENRDNAEDVWSLVQNSNLQEEQKHALRESVTKFKSLTYAQLSAAYPFLAHMPPEAVAKVVSVKLGEREIMVKLMGIFAYRRSLYPVVRPLNMDAAATVEHLSRVFNDKVIDHIGEMKERLRGEEILQLIRVRGILSTEQLNLVTALTQGPRTDQDVRALNEDLLTEMHRLQREAQETQSRLQAGQIELQGLQSAQRSLSAENEALTAQVLERRRSLELFENNMPLSSELGNSALVTNENRRTALAAGVRAFLQGYHLAWQQRLLHEAPSAGIQGSIQYDLLSLNRPRSFFSGTSQGQLAVHAVFHSKRTLHSQQISAVLPLSVSGQGTIVWGPEHTEALEQFGERLLEMARNLSALPPPLPGPRVRVCALALGAEDVEDAEEVIAADVEQQDQGF